MQTLKYLAGYPESLQAQVRTMLKHLAGYPESLQAQVRKMQGQVLQSHIMSRDV